MLIPLAYSSEKDEANWAVYTVFSSLPTTGSPKSSRSFSRRTAGIVKIQAPSPKSPRTASSRCSPWIFRNALVPSRKRVNAGSSVPDKSDANLGSTTSKMAG